MKKQLQEEFKNVEDKTLYIKIGKEPCGALQCFKYQIKNPITPDTIQYTYFDDRDYLMRRITTEDKEGNKTDMVFDYTPFTIKEPSPIKESPPDKIKSSGAGATDSSSPISQEEINKLLEKYKDTTTNVQETPPSDTNAESNGTGE